MEKLKHIKEDLVELVYEQLEANESTNFCHIDTHELGEVIDMIKDISEAIYHCTVVKSMEEGTGTISYTQHTDTGKTTVDLHNV